MQMQSYQDEDRHVSPDGQPHCLSGQGKPCLLITRAPVLRGLVWLYGLHDRTHDFLTSQVFTEVTRNFRTPLLTVICVLVQLHGNLCGMRAGLSKETWHCGTALWVDCAA